jgi:predicted aldo/keto reductase-like oxidoreductase
MTRGHSLKRREFLQCSTAAVIAGLGARHAAYAATDESIEEAVSKVGPLPRRKLGYSGREVSILIGFGGMAPALVEAGVKCGMNYWHLSNMWAQTGVPPVIMNNREAHYCQVIVDRVGGNHETGRIDEEAHYSLVKDVLDKTKLRYFDDMQFHFGYHSRDEVKKNRDFVRAFERLKKEGLVKHLCLSQHGYAGNSRVPGGESAAEILTAVVEDGLFEHAQIMYSYGEDPAINSFLEFARKKKFGITAMKTSRGIGRMKEDAEFMNSLPAGVTPHNALTRWLTTTAKIDAAIIRVQNMAQFIETYSGAGRSLRAADARAIELMTARADRTACRLCTECQPYCPQQVPVAEILRFERYALDDRNLTEARTLYTGLDHKADACVSCGSCMAHCPQKLKIPEKLSAAHSLLGSA